MGFDALAAAAITQTLATQNIQAGEVSVLACDDARITALNGDFRNQVKATNVLSWPDTDLSALDDGAAPRAPVSDPGGAVTLGDIAISFDTCTREAQDQGKPLTDHVTHLLVHGTLHLLGFDHIRDKDATRMESLETEILGIMGVPDPY
ncbi:MAG: rRNA maturation RNase YbeY [Pseudomonadota bacterium]